MTSTLRAQWPSRALYHARKRLAARDQETVASQVTLTEIAAPTGEEGQRAAAVADRFRALGLDGVHVDAAGNVVGTRAGTCDEAPVVICAHLDTVFPRDVALHVRHEGARLIAPGIGDNGRGLAAMLALADVMDGTTLRTRAPVVFAATVGEEGRGDLRGAKELFAGALAGAAAAIALDGAGDERIVHRALGSRRYRIAFYGVGGHSWTSYGVPNAVHAAAIAAAKIARIALPGAPRTTLSVGRIGGGISVNAIPDEAWLEIDLRSTSSAVIERLDREIRAAARAADGEESGRRIRGAAPLSMTIATIGDRPNGETPVQHPLVVMAMEATRLIGRDPEAAT
ncbi:MAG: M20/M25/M40 family metallo-hydrolase, partial [Gemmatimonadaceae bacterium]